MEKHFYIGEGPEADALVAEALEREKATHEAREALISEYEADGLILSVWNDGKVTGLAFNRPTHRPYLKGETRTSGEEGYGYYPKLSTKEGKRLAQKLEAEELTFSASKFILDRLRLHRIATGPHSASRTGHAVYYSVAGIASGKILVKIPGSKNPEHDGTQSFPSIPSWLREVKESEWLAVQGR